MKKIIIIAMALMMVAGMAYAEDRLSLSGELYVRGWDQEGYASKLSMSYDDQDEASWWEQRFRLGGKIAVAEDVSVNFRMDIGEGIWGLDYTPGAVARPRGTGGAYTHANTIDFDRAFIKIDKERWDFTAGQQYMGLGIVQVVDANATGFNLGLKFNPVKVSLLYARLDENGSTTDEGATEDVDLYALNVGYTGDTFSAKAFYAMGNDGTDVDNSPWALGLNGSMGLGMLNFTGELAFLGGDTDAGATDYKGTQLYLACDANITEALKVGAEIVYAMGTDDPNERQLTTLADWDSFTPFSLNLPHMGGWVSAFPNWDAFDPFGISGGVIGGDISASFGIMDNTLRFGAKVGYFQAEEDVNLPGAELTAYNAFVQYMIATNTDVSVMYLVSSPDADNYDVDDAKAAIVQLDVTF